MNNDDHPNAVGYKRPPREHRFVKGKSGNPNGRPKRSKKAETPRKWQDIVFEESQRTVRTTEGEILTMLQAVARATFQHAVSKGTPQALRAVTTMLAELDKHEAYFAPMPSEEVLENITPERALKAYIRMMGGPKR